MATTKRQEMFVRHLVQTLTDWRKLDEGRKMVALLAADSLYGDSFGYGTLSIALDDMHTMLI